MPRLTCKMHLNVLTTEKESYADAALKMGLSLNQYCRLALNGSLAYLKLLGIESAIINQQQLLFKEDSLRKISGKSKKPL